jgi:hypothetical protein
MSSPLTVQPSRAYHTTTGASPNRNDADDDVSTSTSTSTSSKDLHTDEDLHTDDDDNYKPAPSHGSPPHSTYLTKQPPMTAASMTIQRTPYHATSLPSTTTTASKKKSKKECSANKIFAKISKNADQFKLPELSSHKDPYRRRRAFLTFIDKLRSILNITKETSKIMFDTVQWYPPRTRAANQALFWLLEAKTDHFLQTSLAELRSKLQESDGFAALQYLQNTCAARDEVEVHNALRVFQSLTIGEGECIQFFNLQFNKSASFVLAAGHNLTSTEKLIQYFRALRSHPSLLEQYKQAFKQRHPVSLSNLQYVIQRKEETLFPDIVKIAHRRTEHKPSRPPHKSRSDTRGDSRRDSSPR